MIGRRSLMSMMGLAPVVSIMPQAEVNPVPSVVSAMSEMDAVSWAKRNVAAIRWARQNGMPIAEERYLTGPADVIDQEVDAMKSWSPQHKRRVSQDRRLKHYQANLLAGALQKVEREIKLSLAPEWVRRFIN